jgi:Holliday junction resolvasome RuvABC endonuclease subunit
LKLDKLPEPADVGDALAIALCHYYLNREWSALARRNRA